MDTTDPEIVFDAESNCNHCRDYVNRGRTPLNRASQAPRERSLHSTLIDLISKIKADGRGKPYDCIVGVSGGVDSSYVAWLAKDLGLRPLAAHLDNGWNSELAAQNIHTLLTRLDIDLYTQVLDWEEFKDLQLAFLKASTPDCEIPSDHAIFALNYHVTRKFGLRYFLNGSNRQTESIMPRMWSQGHLDWVYIQSVHRRFGRRQLKTFPHLTWAHRQRLMDVSGIQWINILEYIDYNKSNTIEFLKAELGWRPYPAKHGESVYTKFYQEYILPVKFGADKRRAHLSSLIVNGEITREEALRRFDAERPDPAQIAQDKRYVIKKLGLDEEQFDAIIGLPKKSIHDYPNSFFDPVFQKAARIYNKLAAL